MTAVYLLTGSNMGDSQANLSTTIMHIRQRVGEVVKISCLYKTEPWGNKDQQVFLNQVMEVHTELSPQELLKTILGIEHEMGRNRDIKWGPRVIDIDILFFGDRIINESELTIPHPFLHERRFTLVPLVEIAPHLQHPVFHKTIAQLLEECADKGVVEKL
jgi:2-amino-4-hydroxy-6-hydroxymethyldihydropteridine diphosphokinase